MHTTKTSTFSLREFLNLVFKRKTQIMFFFIATVFTVFIGTLIAKPTYEAKTQIRKGHFRNQTKAMRRAPSEVPAKGIPGR